MSGNDTFKSFSTTSTSGNTSFLESNSLVAKFAFMLLVIFAFIILLRVGISLISYLLKPSGSPQLINGMVDATHQIVFPQDPSNNDAVTIYRSINEHQGIEFTWSVWIFINNLQYLEGQYKHIFHKGNSNLEKTGLNFPNNAPGLYLAPNTNKWFNVIIRCKNTTLDVYANGTIIRSVNLVGVPKQNYGDVYVGMNGGFDGNISNLWYYNYALGTAAIQKIVRDGPNTNMIGTTGMNDKNRNYLSLRWFFYGSGDMYNPSTPRGEFTQNS